MVVQAIVNLIPTAQALALLSENVRVVKKRKKDVKDFMKLGVTNIVGLEFIRLESGLIAKI